MSTHEIQISQFVSTKEHRDTGMRVPAVSWFDTLQYSTALPEQWVSLVLTNSEGYAKSLVTRIRARIVAGLKYLEEAKEGVFQTGYDSTWNGKRWEFRVFVKFVPAHHTSPHTSQ